MMLQSQGERAIQNVQVHDQLFSLVKYNLQLQHTSAP